jgi:hypothetical protein
MYKYYFLEFCQRKAKVLAKKASLVQALQPGSFVYMQLFNFYRFFFIASRKITPELSGKRLVL